eukprot:6380821-Prymnesium_polylepis.1
MNRGAHHAHFKPRTFHLGVFKQLVEWLAGSRLARISERRARSERTRLIRTRAAPGVTVSDCGQWARAARRRVAVDRWMESSLRAWGGGVVSTGG